MTAVWRIAQDTQDYTADDATGEGARISGGRWNSQGTPVLYTASSIALALLETVVHLPGVPANRYLVRLDVPPDVWKARKKDTADSLPVGWDALPFGRSL